MLIKISSFGYKCNLEVRADRVYSVIRMPNPYGRFPDRNGLDKEVKEWVLECVEVDDFINRLIDFLSNKMVETIDGSIAFGCRGGKHRSVVIAEEVGRRLRELGFEVEVEHRDLGK